MSASDAIKPAVVAALMKDGWTITDDPLGLDYRDISIGIDLGAERLLAAEKGVERIAVEVKGFMGGSPVRAYRDALGQYEFYRRILARKEPGRKLYLAVGDVGYERVFGLAGLREVEDDQPIPTVVIGVATEEVLRWIG